MNTQEKALLYISMAIVVLGAVLRISHLVDAGIGQLILNAGAILGFFVYRRYSLRLAARVQELESELQQRSAK